MNKLQAQLLVLENTIKEVGYSKVFAQLCSRDNTPLFFVSYAVMLFNKQYNHVNRDTLTVIQVLKSNRV